ncbi:IS3 family transposase [Bacillus hominis]
MPKYVHFYNPQRFQKKSNNLSPCKYRTQVGLVVLFEYC